MNENENMKKHTAQNMKTVKAFLTSKLHEQISSGMMHLKYPLLLIEKSNLCSGGSGFPLSYLNGHLRYVRRHISILKCASASLNKTFPSFLPTSVSWLTYHRLWYVIPVCGKMPQRWLPVYNKCSVLPPWHWVKNHPIFDIQYPTTYDVPAETLNKTNGNW